MSLGLVNKVSVMAPWVLPAPIKAVMATNDWRAAILVMINFAISIIIFYPFFKMYEKNLLKEENQQVENSITM